MLRLVLWFAKTLTGLGIENLQQWSAHDREQHNAVF